MPSFDAIPAREIGPGWGCTCKAFRFGEPTPEEAMGALDRSANVTVEFKAERTDRVVEFTAWTMPGDDGSIEPYNVTFYPLGSDHHTGWCKHVIACMVHYLPWHRQLAVGAGEKLAELHEVKKALRAANRKIERLETKLERD